MDVFALSNTRASELGGRVCTAYMHPWFAHIRVDGERSSTSFTRHKCEMRDIFVLGELPGIDPKGTFGEFCLIAWQVDT